mmetsp:Transcript_91943/g.265252  ORF Transcript_91943/g.265252 Transcript_91943/m.265252 type:complete len:332 (-) Transcript_91943:16-1011(-)
MRVDDLRGVGPLGGQEGARPAPPHLLQQEGLRGDPCRGPHARAAPHRLLVHPRSSPRRAFRGALPRGHRPGHGPHRGRRLARGPRPPRLRRRGERRAAMRPREPAVEIFRLGPAGVACGAEGALRALCRTSLRLRSGRVQRARDDHPGDDPREVLRGGHRDREIGGHAGWRGDGAPPDFHRVAHPRLPRRLGGELSEVRGLRLRRALVPGPGRVLDAQEPRRAHGGGLGAPRVAPELADLLHQRVVLVVAQAHRGRLQQGGAPDSAHALRALAARGVRGRDPRMVLLDLEGPVRARLEFPSLPRRRHCQDTHGRSRHECHQPVVSPGSPAM